MPTVYKLTSPDNEIYIGQTTKTFSERWEEHIKASNYYHNGGCRLLNNKLKARGSETFIKEILVEWEYEDKNDPEKKKRDYSCRSYITGVEWGVKRDNPKTYC